MNKVVPTVRQTKRSMVRTNETGPSRFSIPREGLLGFWDIRNGLIGTIGLSTISGTWPNCIVQAIPGGPLENFGPFAGAAQVNFQNVPEVVNNQFFWGDRGYAFYSTEQDIVPVKRILTYLNSDAEITYLYVDGEILQVDGSQVAVIA